MLSILPSSILWLKKLLTTNFMWMMLGADSVEQAIETQSQLQGLFSQAGFVLRKWNSSESSVLQRIPPDLLDSNSTYVISDTEEYTKTLGLEWNPKLDHFRLTVADLPPLENLTKRLLVSDIAKPLTSWDDSHPHSSKPKSCYSGCGNRRLIGTIQCLKPFVRLGYSGDVS